MQYVDAWYLWRHAYWKIELIQASRLEMKTRETIFLPVSVLACTSRVLNGCPVLSIPKTLTVYCDEGKSSVISAFSSLPFTILWTILLLLFLFDLSKTRKCRTWLPRRAVRFVHWTERLDEVSLLIVKFQSGITDADKSKNISSQIAHQVIVEKDC